MLLDLQQYLLDLVESWTAFMTGGAVAAAVLLIERLRRPLSPKVFMLVFLVFGFGAASFVTWQKEHAARSVAEQNTRKGRSAETVRQLQQYYADAVAYYAQATDAASDEEFKQTEKEADEWATRMGHWVILNMGYGA